MGYLNKLMLITALSGLGLWLYRFLVCLGVTLFEQFLELSHWFYQSADMAALYVVKAAGVPEPTVQEKIIQVIEGWDPVVATSYLVLAVTGFLLASVLLRKSKYFVMKAQGIHFEAMVPGSHFQKGEVPSCQLEVCCYGILSNEFVGYGIRVGEFLVLPYHVYLTAASKGNVLLRGTNPQGKTTVVAVTMEPFKSKVHPDVAYLPLSATTWSLLGTSKARLATNLKRGLVQCAGKHGVVLGNICESTQSMGMVVFGGSTVPGMSGAAYMVANSVHGMHIGHIGTHNTGVSSLLLNIEMEKLFVGEGAGKWVHYNDPSYDAKMQAKQEFNSDETWNKKDIVNAVNYAYDASEVFGGKKVKADWLSTASTAWADEVDDLEAVNTSEKVVANLLQQIHALPPNIRKGLFKSFEALDGCPVKCTGQSLDEVPDVPVPQSVNGVFRDIVDRRLIAVETRTLSLQRRLETVEAQVYQVHEPWARGIYKCPFGCLKPGKSTAVRQFKTVIAAQAHHLLKHSSAEFNSEEYIDPQAVAKKAEAKVEPTVVGESAIKGDCETKESLGFHKKPIMRTQSPTTSISSSESASILLAEKPPSTLIQEGRQSIQDLAIKIEKLCALLHPVINGQSLATQPR